LLNIIGRYVHDQYVFIIDSVDHLQPKTLEWIPDIIPQNVKFIFSLEGDSMTAENLSVRSDTLFLRMSELSGPEKSAAVRCYFAQYGKVLNESGLTSQLSKLCKKRDAGLPLYLKMACDELRLFSSFETLDADLKKLPDLLPDLVAHIVARASQVCGEHLVKTILACIVCARRPLHTSQLQRMLSIWFSAQKDDQLASMFASLQNTPLGTQKGEEKSQSWKNLLLPATAQLLSPKIKLSALSLHVLLAQLSPLLAGFDLMDERSVDFSSEELVEDEEESLEVTSSLLHAQEGRLRFCSSQVASVVQNLCFQTGTSFGRLASARRLGYTTPSSSRLATCRFKTASRGFRSAPPPPPELFNTPNRFQTYMLLLIEFAKDTTDAVYYAFHAGQLRFVRLMLSSVDYLQKKAIKHDMTSLLEEYLGFLTVSPEILAAWKDEILQDNHDAFQACRAYVLRSSSLLAKFPRLTAQLIIENSSDLGMICAKELDAMRLPYRVIRYSKSSTNVMSSPAIVFRPSCATGSASPTSITATSDGALLACGSENGSISLLDSSNGKELHTFYGHTSAVLAMVFLESEDQTNTSLLFSTSADASACLWRVSRTLGVSGLRLSRLTGVHTRAITCCAWNRHERVLVTSGLDGLVKVYHIEVALQGGDVTNTAAASAFDLSSFKKPAISFTTNDQPINAMILAQKRIFVGCWNGSIWVFDRKSPKLVRAQIYSSTVDFEMNYEGKRDSDFYSNEAPYVGKYAAIVSLAYSGQKYHLLASLDFNGEVLLINADSMTCMMRLESAGRLPSTLTGRLTFFRNAGSPNACLLAYAGSERATHGSIFVWDVNRTAQNVASLTTSDVIEDTTAVCSGSVLPVGHCALVGYASGNCYTLSSEAKRPVHFGSPETGAVQVMDCTLFTSDTSQPSAAALIVYGTPGGAVVFTPLRANLPSASDSLPTAEILESATLLPPRQQSKAKANNIFWSHAVGGQAAGGGKAGGTLSVAAGFGVAASGGGDATCWFYFYDDDAVLEGDWIFSASVCTTEHNAGVSAVAILNELAVSGGKDGLLAFYKINADQKQVTPVHREPLGHMDWVTTIAMVECEIPGESETVFIVASGGNDHRLLIWSVSKALFVSCLSILTDHMTGLTHLTFKGDILASASSDGCLILWQTNTFSVSRLRRIFVDGVSQRGGRMCALKFKGVGDEPNDDEGSNSVRSASSSESISQISLHLFDSEASGDEKADSQDSKMEKEPEELPKPMDVDEGTVKRPPSSWSPTVIDACNGAVLHARENFELLVGITGADGCLSRMTVEVLSPFSARAADCLLGHPSATAAGVQLAPIFQNADGLCLASAAGSTFEGTGDVRLWKLQSKDSLSGDSEQVITHSRAVTAVLRLVHKERYTFSSSLDGSIIVWREEEICGQSVWAPCLKMLLYDFDTDDMPPSPISAMNVQVHQPPDSNSAKAVLFALCGKKLFYLTINLRKLKSIPVSTTFTVCELKERFTLKIIDLPVSGFSLTFPGPSAAEESSLTILVGTGFGFLLRVQMLPTQIVRKLEPEEPRLVIL
uniref:WD_REPEATS_REGION domain-containing protein n=1 Tax=Schistocephalus solidus TaxID=70667 RepID=A0A183TBS9_SCHSO